MKMLFDLVPVIVFFLAYFIAGRSPETAAAIMSALLGHLGVGGDVASKQAPLLLATAIAIVATLGQVLWLLARGKKVEKMLWISVAVITLMGGATLILRDSTFIMWKPTVLYWALAAVLLIGQFVFRKNLIRAMGGQQLSLPEPVWTKLNLSWAVFFAILGGVNLYVAFHFSEATWVKFKLFGVIGLMLVFALAQGFILSRYLETEKEQE